MFREKLGIPFWYDIVSFAATLFARDWKHLICNICVIPHFILHMYQISVISDKTQDPSI